MSDAEQERLINQGFRIIRRHNNNIQIRTKRLRWILVSQYSEERWNELINHPKTLIYYGK